jgi:hypothetical protein
MREYQVGRDIFERQSRRAQGLSPLGNRLSVINVTSQPYLRDYLHLPEAVDGLTSIQTATGAFVFMLDFSALDGADPLA